MTKIEKSFKEARMRVHKGLDWEIPKLTKMITAINLTRIPKLRWRPEWEGMCIYRCDKWTIKWLDDKTEISMQQKNEVVIKYVGRMAV